MDRRPLDEYTNGALRRKSSCPSQEELERAARAQQWAQTTLAHQQLQQQLDRMGEMVEGGGGWEVFRRWVAARAAGGR